MSKKTNWELEAWKARTEKLEAQARFTRMEALWIESQTTGGKLNQQVNALEKQLRDQPSPREGVWKKRCEALVSRVTGYHERHPELELLKWLSDQIRYDMADWLDFDEGLVDE